MREKLGAEWLIGQMVELSIDKNKNDPKVGTPTGPSWPIIQERNNVLVL